MSQLVRKPVNINYVTQKCKICEQDLYDGHSRKVTMQNIPPQ